MTPQRQRLHDALETTRAARRQPYPELVAAWDAYFTERRAWHSWLRHVRHSGQPKDTQQEENVIDLQRAPAGSRAAMQSLLFAEVKSSGMRQVEVASAAGITEKHLSQIMRGHITGGLDVIDAILAACGRELVLSTRVLLEGEDRS
jgi:hypothetical protein